jgi:hypothetical protein
MTDHDKLDMLIDIVKENQRETAEWREDVEERIEKTEQQLFMYKTIIKAIKWTVGVIAALVTLKFGDVVKYFSH